MERAGGDDDLVCATGAVVELDEVAVLLAADASRMVKSRPWSARWWPIARPA
jgi:hypothetical protein